MEHFDYVLKDGNKLEKVALEGTYKIHWIKDGQEWGGTKTAADLPAWIEWAKKHATAYGYEREAAE